jgi:hypothetical protein
MILRLGILLAVTAAMASYAFSDSVFDDPKVVFHPPSQSGGGGPPQSDLTGTIFSFISPTGTSPGTSACVIDGVDDDVCDFLNLSGVDWTTLQFTVSPGGDLSSCQPLFGFTNCDVSQQGNSTSPTIFTLSGGTGIPDGTAFGFSTQGWAEDALFDVVANGAANVPEPSSAASLLGGLVLVFVLLKRAKIAKQTT